MSKLKEIRNRITSIKNTRQVTSAMKMVSAAKFKKAQDQIMQIVPYHKKMEEIIQTLGFDEIVPDIHYYFQPEIQKVLIIVIGSNQGLCGGFNSNVVKSSIDHTFINYEGLLKKGNVSFLPVGRQVERGLRNLSVVFEGQENHLLSDFYYEEVSRFTHKLIKWFSEGKFQRIDIVYNRFKNAALQELTADQFLPIRVPSKPDQQFYNADYIYEPSKKEILGSLIPQWLFIQLYRILLDSVAAEHGARMTAMHKATDNATELLNELRVTYNNARQSAITNEIVEITAGAEALKG